MGKKLYFAVLSKETGLFYKLISKSTIFETSYYDRGTMETVYYVILENGKDVIIKTSEGVKAFESNEECDKFIELGNRD